MKTFSALCSNINWNKGIHIENHECETDSVYNNELCVTHGNSDIHSGNAIKSG